MGLNTLMTILGQAVTPPAPIPDPPPQGTLVTAKSVFVPIGDSNTANGIWPARFTAIQDNSKFEAIPAIDAYAGFVADGISGRNGVNQGVRGGLLMWVLPRVFQYDRQNIGGLKATTNDINNGGSDTGARIAYTYLSNAIFEYGFRTIGTVIADPGRDGSGNNTKPAYLTYLPWMQQEGNLDGALKWDAIHDESLDPRTEGYLPAYASYWADTVHHSVLGSNLVGDDFYAKALELHDNVPCYYPDAITSLVINNTTHTVNFIKLEGYPNASDYQYTTNGGITVQRATVLPIPIPSTVNAGLFGVRVGPKIVNGVHNNPSAWIFNSVDAIGSGGYAAEEYITWFDSRIDGAQNFNQLANYYIYVSSPGGWIQFTIREGFKFEFDYGIYGGGIWLAEVSEDDGDNWTTIGTATQGPDNPIFDYHSGTSTTKLIRLTTQANGTGSYNIFSGVTLYE